MAVRQLEKARQPISQKVVGEMVGLRINNLKAYPYIRALLERKATEHAGQMSEASSYEDGLLAAVEFAIVQLETSGQRVTQRNVSEIVGKHRSTLQRYPRVRKLFSKKGRFRQYYPKARDKEGGTARSKEELTPNLEDIGITGISCDGQIAVVRQ